MINKGYRSLWDIHGLVVTIRAGDIHGLVVTITAGDIHGLVIRKTVDIPVNLSLVDYGEQ